MEIAITADVHLFPGEKPERLNALRNIFEQVEVEGIDVLIIAGDLFDEDVQDFKDFESLCHDHPKVQVKIIAGNHDPALSHDRITAGNVKVHDSVELVEIGDTPFLFVPYSAGKNMGEQIAGKKSELEEVSGKWVLVSHGDFIGGVTEREPYEKGIYMPLYRKDLDIFRPLAAFLGHIHLPDDLPESVRGKVVYPGSPCGLEISETGRRRFLVYETADGSLESRDIKTDVLFFRESFLVIPGGDEVSRLQQEITGRIEDWQLKPSEDEKVQVRVEATGYAYNRREIAEALESGFSDFKIENEVEDQTAGVLHADKDEARTKVATETLKAIEGLGWNFADEIEPNLDEVKEEALHVIYQVGK